MTVDSMTVAGRRFGSKADYEAALRDQKKIDIIKAETDLNSPKQIYDLFNELQSGIYRFETVIGTDFDDEIYEKVEELKAKGITSANAASFEGLNRKKGKQVKKETKAAKKASTGKQKKQRETKAGKKQNKKSVKLADYDADMQKQILAELKRQEKRRKWIVTAASLVAVICFGYFGVYYFISARTGASYETLASLKGSNTLSDAVKENDFSIHKTGVKLPDVLDEYKTLYQKNKRLIGWLKIDDTIIDYPVMQTADNEYYLEHNFNQEYDKNGSIFLDYNCSVYPEKHEPYFVRTSYEIR